MNISVVESGYGPLKGGQSFIIKSGYQVICGKNDIGKSAFLQYIFKELLEHEANTRENSCLILSDRNYTTSHTRGSVILRDYNQQLYQTLQNQPRRYEQMTAPNQQELYAILLQTDNYLEQVIRLNEYLVRMGFKPVVFKEQHSTFVDSISLPQYGAGLRALLPILAALTSDIVQTIIIDEPEISLEAGAQKVLRSILVEAGNRGKRIIVATHSHLFLNRGVESFGSNFQIFSDLIEPKNLKIEAIQGRDELMDLTYNLLGNSLEDLFFPNNFLIVEGASDQYIMEAIARLLGIKSSEVKILSARGIDGVTNLFSAIEYALTPLLAGGSPYAKKVVVMIDKPNSSSNLRVKELKKNLDSRLLILNEKSIEEYIHESIYKKAGKIKDEVLSDLEKLSKDTSLEGYKKIISYKKELSCIIGSAIEIDDLPVLFELVNCLNLAKK